MNILKIFAISSLFGYSNGQKDWVYDFEQAGIGATEEEALNDYGIKLNKFETFSQDIRDSNKTIMFYVFHSDQFSKTDT